ncbi:hypothetical protein EVAR_90563_1 [Eumeta japonica]|uniref:Mos1 transposase HTH domain-containing protein n=1 Tax=Eumeta variegata TaxID=151549 RepID=A0A4C1YWH7_EUMVA|nr:hypothetical protein EVAR_90563_1 [Eumeta japonica]
MQPSPYSRVREAMEGRVRVTFHDEPLSLAAIHNWFNEFKRGCSRLTDDLYEGRLSSAMTEDNISTVQLMIDTGIY